MCVYVCVCVCWCGESTFLLFSLPLIICKVHNNSISPNHSIDRALYSCEAIPEAGAEGARPGDASPKESVSFALHSVASRVFFRRWSVDHPHQDPRDFLFRHIPGPVLRLPK